VEDLGHRRRDRPGMAPEVALGIREGEAARNWDHGPLEDPAAARAHRRWQADLAGGILAAHLVDEAWPQCYGGEGMRCAPVQKLELERIRA
jgi:hypothetical protein